MKNFRKLLAITAIASTVALSACSPGELLIPGNYAVNEAEFENNNYSIEIEAIHRRIYVDKETFIKAVESGRIVIADDHSVDADLDGEPDFQLNENSVERVNTN